MAVDIKQIFDNELTVNNKEVYQDSNNNWIAREELTTAEHRALRLHINAKNQQRLCGLLKTK